MSSLMNNSKLYLVTILLYGLSITVLPLPAAEPPEESGLTPIFNGQDLSGWDGDPALWKVQDGVIRGETTPEKKAKGNTFLIYQEAPIADFELRLSYRLNATNNSGIQYRSQRIEDAKNPWVVRGYQHEIRNEVKMPKVSGFIYSEGGLAGNGFLCNTGEKAVRNEEGKKEVLETLITQEEFEKLFKLDDWNDVVIVARGNHIRHFLNGRLILDYTDKGPKALSEGVIALQLHAGSPMWVEYKNIRLKKY